MSEKLMSRGDVLAVLRDVQFRPSCVDMGWEWVVEAVYYLDEEVPRGWLVATTFMRPDTETGVVGKGTGRQWFVERGASASGLVKTAFAAAKMILEHELMEAFTYKGERIFDPHHTVLDLSLACLSKKARE